MPKGSASAAAVSFFSDRKRRNEAEPDEQKREKLLAHRGTLAALCGKKGIDYQAFNASDLSIGSEFSQHAHWVFKHILSLPYIDDDEYEEGDECPRYYHGMLHACRVAELCHLFLKFYGHCGHAESAAMLQNALQLQLAKLIGLFHDTGREDEGDDRWDHDSATLCYFYLTKVCHCPEGLAKQCAEAIANKEYVPGREYLSLSLDGEKWTWHVEVLTREQSVFQCILHDADCLDILRCKYRFDVNYLFCSRLFVSTSDPRFNEYVNAQIAQLVEEQRALIKLQGDLRNIYASEAEVLTNYQIKIKYEKPDCYRLLRADIERGKFPNLKGDWVEYDGPSTAPPLCEPKSCKG